MESIGSDHVGMLFVFTDSDALWGCSCPPQATKVMCSARLSNPGSNGDPGLSVKQADFCPSDASVVAVTGDRILRFYRVADGQLKPLASSSKMDPQLYTGHCWLDHGQASRPSSAGLPWLLLAPYPPTPSSASGVCYGHTARDRRARTTASRGPLPCELGARDRTHALLEGKPGLHTRNSIVDEVET